MAFYGAYLMTEKINDYTLICAYRLGIICK